eukprot:g10841.t1
MAPTDLDASLALYNATDGPSWVASTGWGTDAPLSNWFGVKVNCEGRAVKLILTLNVLRGNIPPQLGQLGALTHLDLSNNRLDGNIPPQLGQLGALESLNLADNKLDGAIPPELGDLRELQELWLSINQLTGAIPPELGDLRELRDLRLNHNQLTGHIPQQLGNLSAVENLVLSHNKLVGPIPAELGALRELRELWLDNNELTTIWDHTQEIDGVGREEQTDIESGGTVPSQLLRLLDVFDRSDLELYNNPWTEPPESIVFKGAKRIRGYFEDLFSEPCRIQRNSVKVVLVGQEGAGKTSLCRSMKANKAAPTGEWKENSTIFADVEPMVLEGASVRVYDCAGQVAYTGLLQMFLTSRPVCVLVCDAAAFGKASNGVGGLVDRDCRKLEELCVCDWLRSISRRVPGNDVVLVATKCDLAGGNPRETGRRIEEACRTWLADWVRDGMEPVGVEEGVCLTSCCVRVEDGVCCSGFSKRGNDSSGNHASSGAWACDWRDSAGEASSPGFLHRLVNKPDGGGLRGAQMVLPRSWDISLTGLEALELGRDPVEMIVRKLGDTDGGQAVQLAESEGGGYHGITVEELRAKWHETVRELARRGITVTNPENALEGALSIREFEGSLVRHEMFVFLDVVWLARVLKPLLNHKDEKSYNGSVKLGDSGGTCITLRDPVDIASWSRLKVEGILEPRLAQAMWPAGLSEYVLPTLLSLGLAFSLGNDPAGEVVVLLRLQSDRPAGVGKVMDTFRSKNDPVFTASWKFFLGVPPGAIEKVLTRCCSIGGVRVFWRFGVLVHGSFGDGGGGSGIFAVDLEYAADGNKLTAQVYGDICDPAPWAALSYAISAVRVMLLEFPGLHSEGSLRCPQPKHGGAMPFTTATRAGDKILLERAGGKPGCPLCSSETGGRGAAAAELLLMVDIRRERDEIFHEVKTRFDALDGRYSLSRQSTDSRGGNVLDRIVGTVNRIEGTANRIEGTVNLIKGGMQEILMSLKNLQGPNYPFPHVVVVEEVKTQGKRSLVTKVRDTFVQDMTLHFLCPVDMSKVPCGVNGEGYRFRETRGWVKKLSPVLQVAVVTAKVALKASAGLDVDISEFLQAVKEGGVEEIADRTLDEEALSRVVSGEEVAGADMQRDTRASYEALKDFMEREDRKRRKNAKDDDGYIDFSERMQRLSDGKGGMVWVRTENVQRWRDSHPNSAPWR